MQIIPVMHDLQEGTGKVSQERSKLTRKKFVFGT